MKTIDSAINEFKGVWPSWADMTEEPICWCEVTNKWFQLTPPTMYGVGEKHKSAVCTRTQFTRRMRYLSN